MSYDVSLEVSAGGADVIEVFWKNHTSNTSIMWRKAGCDLSEFDERLAKELAESLRPALGDILARRDHYAQWNPDNRWGSVGSTIGFLGEILAACDAFPEAIVRVSR